MTPYFPGLSIDQSSREGGSVVADSDCLEPALRMSEQLGALDDAHFLGAASRRTLQHGEDRGHGVTQRMRRVPSPNASRYVERSKEITCSGRADRQFRRAHAPGPRSFGGKGVDLVIWRVGEFGRGDNDGRWTASQKCLRLR